MNDMDTVTTPSIPAIPDLQSGLDTISGLPLAKPQQAEGELSRFFDSLLYRPPPVAVYLELLEQAREPLCFVEEELARQYVNKPLPLSHGEEAAFRQVVAIWFKAAKAYAHCAQLDAEADDSDHLYRVALMLHRSIYYAGMVLVEHHRARRELPAELWLDLHEYYSAAEEWGVASVVVSDALDLPERATHCTAAYLSLLLSELARPYCLSIRDQSLVRRWANNWSPLVSLRTPDQDETIPPFAIDLMHDAGLSSTADCEEAGRLRLLDTTRLAMQLSQLRQQLRKNVPPEQVGLGEDCTAGQCRRLLEHLANPWTQTRAPRKFRRRATSGISKICVGFDAMHFFIAGKEFAEPVTGKTYTHTQYENLFSFRDMVQPDQPLQVRQEQLGYTLDLWEEVNQTPNGFRLMRNTIGKRVSHGQLIAVCPHDSERFLLARITWLMQDHAGGLVAGLAVLDGLPQAVALRPIGQMATHSEKFGRAFLLPAVPAVGSEQSLVLPQGTFHPGRLFELHTEASYLRVEIKHVLEDGPDFEQVSFDVVG